MRGSATQGRSFQSKDDDTSVHIAVVSFLESLLPSEISLVGAAKYVPCVPFVTMKFCQIRSTRNSYLLA